MNIFDDLDQALDPKPVKSPADEFLERKRHELSFQREEVANKVLTPQTLSDRDDARRYPLTHEECFPPGEPETSTTREMLEAYHAFRKTNTEYMSFRTWRDQYWNVKSVPAEMDDIDLYFESGAHDMQREIAADQIKDHRAAMPPGLRELQDKEPLTNLLNTLQQLNLTKDKTKPIILKIAPDLTNEQLLDIIEIVETTKIDGVIATNTTISREGISSENKNEMGGLSGKPLTKRATEVIRFLSEKSNNAFPIIGVGGIHSAKDALEKLDAGASLVQLYTGFIYEGPGVINEINTGVYFEPKTPLKDNM